MDRLEDMSVTMVEQSLRETGLVLPPTVHVLLDGLDLPYVGYLTCRPFYRGEDAAQAVRAMGLVGSMLDATIAHSRAGFPARHAEVAPRAAFGSL